MPYVYNDSFKRYPLRFGGYGFGIAEALSGSVSYPVINGLRLAATGFIFAHTIVLPAQVGKKTNSSLRMAVAAGDTFVYETLASGLIPPLVAMQIRNAALKIPVSPGPARAWLPAALSLASLPIIIPPSDSLVDLLMDVTIRQLYP